VHYSRGFGGDGWPARCESRGVGRAEIRYRIVNDILFRVWNSAAKVARPFRRGNLSK